ncbi:MAG: ribose-5-phosphate isomerase RpiA [Deltaproteobacteria bacterium]|nr:ribose-5-phosphate isomerase RpiA [Deltaproteobacteria bacterium]
MRDGFGPLKDQAAARAVALVESGMVVGLGHGTTAAHALRRLAERLRVGEVRDVMGVPCSRFVEAEAARLGVPLTTFEAHPVLDLTIDGADEVSPELDLLKGRGGALLREKIVAQASRRVAIVVDESKLSPCLGTRRPVPVEVLPFGCCSQVRYLESLGARVVPRKADGRTLFVTDQGNLILDCDFGPLSEPRRLADQLGARAGIVEHGLFLGLATEVIVAGPGGIRHLRRGGPGAPS